MKLSTLLTAENRQKIKALALNIGGILILNVTIQFILYPFIQRRLGNEAYGVALSLLSLVSITANTIGTAANYSRTVNELDIHPSNGDYNLFLLFGGVLSCGIGAAFLWMLDLFTPVYVLCYSLLILTTSFRYYSDVEFKINGNFLRYFLFYALISLGYVAGLAVYHLTGNWITAVVTGEAFGILYAVFASGIYQRPFKASKAFHVVLTSLLLLLFSVLFENLTLNADRLVLLALSGGEEVSIYYTASLFGKVAALLTVPLNAVIISYLIRYKEGLTRKLWSVFAIAAPVVGAVVLGGCMLGSYIVLPFLYPDLFDLAKPILFPAIACQVLYFVSGVLLIVLLRFRGEKMQFLFNLGYVIEFFGLSILGTYLWGLDGFVWTSLIANALRLVAVVLWGFLPERKKNTPADTTAV